MLYSRTSGFKLFRYHWRDRRRRLTVPLSWTTMLDPEVIKLAFSPTSGTQRGKMKWEEDLALFPELKNGSQIWLA